MKLRAFVFICLVLAAVGLLEAAERHEGNRVLIVNNGYDALLLRVHLIRSARQSINVQTFIWTNDECGRLVMCELIRAARRGVKVRIIADHFVSDKNPETVAYVATVDPNLELKHYRPIDDRIRPSVLRTMTKVVFKFRALNQRMHNKIMTFDDSIAITGGRNIENTYFNHSAGMNFKDRDVMVSGPVVADVVDSFEEFWQYRHSIAAKDLVDVAKAIKRGGFARPESKEDFRLGGFFRELDLQADDKALIRSKFMDGLLKARRVEFISDKPGKNRSPWLGGQGRITKRIKSVAKDVEETLVVQSPYLVLSRTAVKIFKRMRAKRPNVEITVSSNSFGSTDNTAAYSANYRLRSVYIEQLGFRVYEYRPHPGDLLKHFSAYEEFKKLARKREGASYNGHNPFLCIHAKSFVADDRIAYIGSYNLDPRSGNLNTEVGLLIEDRRVASELKKDILNDCMPGNSWVIAKRRMPLGMDKLNSVLEGVMDFSPVDLWPICNTSSFELRDGKEAIPPGSADFYSNYKDVGSFPGAPAGLSTKEITTRLYKVLGVLATPLL